MKSKNKWIITNITSILSIDNAIFTCFKKNVIHFIIVLKISTCYNYPKINCVNYIEHNCI